MDLVQIGRWTIASDPEATRRAYAAIPTGSPEECGCTQCLNFAAQRERVYPSSVLSLFEKLGVTSNKEAEIYHMARLESGKHFYGGWFHLVGSLVSGADAARQIAENLWVPDLETETEFFTLGFTERRHLIRKQFEGLPVIQFEFTAKISWVLEAEEPR